MSTTVSGIIPARVSATTVSCVEPVFSQPAAFAAASSSVLCSVCSSRLSCAITAALAADTAAESMVSASSYSSSLPFAR